MNSTTLEGNATQAGGQVKEALGKATGDRQMQGSGVADQLNGFVQKNLGQAGPLADKAKAFAKQRPAATAALVGVVGLALLNTLRGRS